MFPRNKSAIIVNCSNYQCVVIEIIESVSVHWLIGLGGAANNGQWGFSPSKGSRGGNGAFAWSCRNKQCIFVVIYHCRHNGILALTDRDKQAIRQTWS